MEQSGYVRVDGFELGYRVEGEGVPVLVIGSAIYYPRLFSQELRKRLKLVFVDHRGFVRPPRDLEPGDYTLDRIVDDIERMREALDLRDFVILGHSGHAFMAMEYALKYPDAVRRVALLNTAPTNSKERQEGSFRSFMETAGPERKAKFERDIAKLAAEVEADPARRFVHLLIRMEAHSFYNLAYDSAPLWDGVYTNMEIIDHLWGEAFARLHLDQTLKSFSKPVFLGLGRHDYLVAPVSLWDGVGETGTSVRKTVFEHSGHNPMLEEPERFDSLLTDWICGP